MFIIGDEVIVRAKIQLSDSVNLYGKKGKIVSIVPDGFIGVDFGYNIDGHDCDGACQKPNGWYVKKSEIEYENPNLCRVGVGNRLSVDSLKGPLTGTVKVVLLSQHKFAFEYDEPIAGGHTCDGYTKDGHGSWFMFFDQKLFTYIGNNVTKGIKIGDIVKAKDYYGVVKKDMNGTVVGTFQVNEESVFEVSWFGLTAGHDCSGKCTFGSGYNLPEDYLEKVIYIATGDSSLTIGSSSNIGGWINVQGATNTVPGVSIGNYDYPNMHSKDKYYHPTETELSFVSQPLRTNHIQNTKEIEDLLLINM